MASRTLLIVALVVMMILTMGCGTPEPTPAASLHPSPTSPPPAPTAVPAPTKTFPPPTEPPPLPPTAVAPTDTPQPPAATATPVPTAESTPEGAWVTFVNNAGFLMTAGGRKILIDALYGGEPAGVLNSVVAARPPFDAIDLILVTHEHSDHFSPRLVARAMSHSPGAVFVSSRRAVEQLLAVDDSLQDRAIPIQLQAGESEQLDVNGIAVEALYISHGMPNLLNLGFVITVGDVRFFHTGDSTADDITVAYLQSYGLPEMQLDAAFVPYFYLTMERYHAYALEGIQARYLIPMHHDYRNPPLGVEDDFPNAIVFRDTLERWELPLAAEATPATAAEPSPSGGRGVIAFSSNRDGNDEIYVMAVPEGTDAAGSEQRNLTHHPASDVDPSWSPDGSQIAFSSNRDGDYEIYVMDADGDNVRRLTSNPAVDAGPVWSPDGRQITFVSLRAGNCQIFLINADGSGLQRLTQNSYDDWEIDWSPDGTQIAVASQVGQYSDIYTFEVEAALQGSAERRQLTDTDGHDAYPRWSPDGSQIAFISNRAGDENWEVYVMDSDGSNQVQLTDSAGTDGIPTWSPDGTQIAFESDRDGDKEIYVLSVAEALQNPEGAEVQRLTDNNANDQKPQWRPSGAPVARVLAQLEGLPIDEFFDESFRQLQLRDPDTLIANGLAEYGVEKNDRFSDSSDRYIRETQQLESAILDLLRSYDRSALSSEQQLSYDIYEWVLEDLVRRQEFMYYNYPINSVGLWDTLTWVINLMVDSQPITNRQQAEDYVARLSQIDTWVEQLLEGLELREQAGLIPPGFLVQRSIDQIGLHLQQQGDGSFDAQAIQLYTSFREKLEQVDGINAEQRQALLDAALTEIEDTVIPALLELREYLIHLETIASDVPGVGKLPQGEAYYNYILRHWTGTDLSADQVHELGLAEVARVQAELRETAAGMGYPDDISMAELDQLFSGEGDFLQGDALKEEYERLIAQADGAMKGFFDLRPSTEVVVRYDPAAPPAYYQEPPPDGSGPGQMVANLANSAQFIFYNPPVLVHHETIPGHHVQIALAQELDLPTRFQRDLIFDVYRQRLPFEAYTEGWALYAEGLAWEMGLYEDDPLNNLGRLRLRLHRTARMVVDTGIHAKGWTVQEAIDYLEEATGAPYNQNRLAQIIAVPGQACGYNIGMLKILELRQRAMEQLGDGFDIKAFHNVILGHGPMPLQILERVVDDWIAAGGPAESVAPNTPVAQPPPGGGGRIAFASMRDGTLDIYVMDVDSGNVTRLTNDPQHDSGPAWSPDGTRIAFMSERNANHDLYVMDASGSNVARLTTHSGDDYGATWSPDGARIAFTSNRSGNLDIYVMDADGSNVTRLTDNPADDANAAWSPDGAHIAFASDRDGDLDIYVMDADGSNVTRLTDNLAQDVDPAWSPDGTQVVFVSNRDSSNPASYASRDNNWEIYVIKADGSNAIRLTDHPAYDIAPRWSPDGRRIVFTSARDGDTRIYIMDADGSNQVRLTGDSAVEETPAWSP